MEHLGQKQVLAFMWPGVRENEERYLLRLSNGI